ncbi:GntR family transcriptional regulator [Thalassotalea agariperforans]
MNAQPIQSIEQQVTEILRNSLIDGVYESGTKMNETLLSDDFGLSRNVIRRALLILYKEGLLHYVEGQGYFVISRLNKNIDKILFNIRSSIEKYAVKIFKNIAAEQDFIALENILSRMNTHYQKSEHLEFIKADIEFHEYFVRLAGGDDLFNLWYPVVIRMHMNKGISATLKTDVEEHASILHALKNYDAENAITVILNNIT